MEWARQLVAVFTISAGLKYSIVMSRTKAKGRGPLAGRGALSNPQGRFERREIEAVDDGWYAEEAPTSIVTSVTPDRARGIITRNDSPDLPFEYSINPYRGCEHGCIYCMSGDTPVLMADGTRRPLADLRPGDTLYGTMRVGAQRCYARTHVLANFSVVKPAFRLTLTGGTMLVAGSDHRFLTEQGWKYVRGGTGSGGRPRLTPGDRLMGLPVHAVPAADLAGQEVESGSHLRVASVVPLGASLKLHDITTGTGDFIANGVVSHNCYARPSHAYLGLSSGIDFETRLLYKADAGQVLEEELARPGYVVKPITIGANTDPYQPVERTLRVTRSILEVLTRTRHPLSIITKSSLILRDLDLLTDLASDGLVNVAISVTTLDADTKRALEPRTASPAARLRVLSELKAAGVPAGVMVAPVIPAITDHEMEAILAAAAAAGAGWAGYILIRLPHEVKDLFREWLAQHFPERAAHVMALIRDMRGGRDNDPQFGSRMRGQGPLAALLRSRFQLACGRLGLSGAGREIPQPTHLFRRPGPGGQLSLGL
jgi:DNA repair photolyase